MGREFKKVLILADYGSMELAKKVHAELSKLKMHGGLEPFDPNHLYINRFNNGEIDVAINSHVRGRDVFLIKSFNVCPGAWDSKAKQSPPLEELVYQPNEGMMELLLVNDALWRAEASEVTDVVLHMPYQRQDRRPKRNHKFVRSPVSAKIVANEISGSGVNRLLTLEPHFRQFEGFNSIPVNCLESFVLNAEYIEKNFGNSMDRVIFVSPDHGGVERARMYASHFKRPYAIVDKRRPDAGVSEVMNIITDQNLGGMSAILIDDLIDTGGTIIKASLALREKGVKDFTVCCTHPLLSGTAKDDLLKNNITLVTTDSIMIKGIEKYPNLKVMDTSYLVAGAVYCICNGESISDHLVDYMEYKKKKEQMKPTP